MSTAPADNAASAALEQRADRGRDSLGGRSGVTTTAAATTGGRIHPQLATEQVGAARHLLAGAQPRHPTARGGDQHGVRVGVQRVELHRLRSDAAGSGGIARANDSTARR